MRDRVATLEDIQLGDIAEPVASVCQSIHSLALALSAKMKIEQKRDNYITPTNFLDLLHGFKDMLKEGEGTEYRINAIQFNAVIPDYIFSKGSLKQ